MPLKPAEFDELTRLIAVEVPALMLAQVVKEQNLVTDFDKRVKEGPKDTGARNHQLVAGVLAAYDAAAQVHRFLTRLYEKMD